MRAICLSLLLLSGCVQSYQPELTTAPADQSKYESDLASCKKRATEPSYGKTATVAAFGILGVAAVAATSDKDDAFFKNKRTLIDECMAADGYSIQQVAHCC